MTDDRNPGLQALFDAARPADASSAFVERVMAEIAKDRRRTVIGWAIAALLLAPVAWWLTGPIVGIMNLAAELLPDSLIEVETTWLAATADRNHPASNMVARPMSRSSLVLLSSVKALNVGLAVVNRAATARMTK